MKSAFTEMLQLFGEYSEKVDNETFSDSDYIEYQRLEARIIDAYKIGYFHNMEYRALTSAYFYIKEGARDILKLDRY